MKKGMNIVLIVSDTFRLDNLGCYGNKHVRTPHLDKLAEHSIVFERCYASSFPTMPARADLFTGKWTYASMGWEPLTPTLASKGTVLSEILRSSGYNTKAVVDTPFFIRNGMNYDRGFVDFEWIRGQGHPWYLQSRSQRDTNLLRRCEKDYCSPSSMIASSEWLENNHKEKFFLYVDTWDPHEPWDPPHWYVEQYYNDYDGNIVQPCYGYWEKLGLTEEKLRIAYASYCGEVTMVDRWIGYLVDGLEAMNLMDNTAIVFTSDHGFYFGEHGIFGKMIGIHEMRTRARDGAQGRVVVGWARSPLYEEVAHIPLLIYIPDAKSRRVDSLVSLPDVMPTILDLAKQNVPKGSHSQSLLPLIEEKEDDVWDFVVTAHPLKGHNGHQITKIVDDHERRILASLPSTITTKDWSLIYSIENEPAELYHLLSDPKQQKNLINEKPDLAQDLIGKFVARLENVGANPNLINLRRLL